MSPVPVNVFGRSSDATAVVYQLLARFPAGTLSVEGDLSTVRVDLPPGHPGAQPYAINVGTGYFDGAAGQAQRDGMAAFLRQGELAGPGLDDALAAIPALRTAVAIVAVGDDDGPLDPEVDDAVLEAAIEVAGWVDGFVLSMGHGELYGPDGTVWASIYDDPDGDDLDDVAEADDDVAEGDQGEGAPVAAEPPSDQSADIPASLIEAAAQAGDLGAGVVLVDLPEEYDVPEPAPVPPPLARAVARLLVLVAVSARCLTEEDGRHLVEARDGINGWCDALGIAGEVEEHERAVLAAEPGTIDRAALVDGSWGAEAAAVLAANLGLLELPAADVLVAPQDLYEALAFPDAERTIELLAAARLPSAEELAAQQVRLRTVHWRLRELGLRPGPLDLAEVAATSWFPLDVTGLVLVDGDLGIDGVPVAEAEPDAVRLATSIALERHRAAAWLVEGGRYSDTELST